MRGQGQDGNDARDPPRSPSYSRPMANWTSGGVGVSGQPQTGLGGPNGGPNVMSAAMLSPRLSFYPHPRQPGEMPPNVLMSSPEPNFVRAHATLTRG